MVRGFTKQKGPASGKKANNAGAAPGDVSMGSAKKPKIKKSIRKKRRAGTDTKMAGAAAAAVRESRKARRRRIVASTTAATPKAIPGDAEKLHQRQATEWKEMKA